jgi:hypothetical protein
MLFYSCTICVAATTGSRSLQQHPFSNAQSQNERTRILGVASAILIVTASNEEREIYIEIPLGQRIAAGKGPGEFSRHI